MLLIYVLTFLFFQPAAALLQQSHTVTAHSAVSVPGQTGKIYITDSVYGLKKKTELYEWRVISPEQVFSQHDAHQATETDFEPVRHEKQQSWLFYLFLGLLFFIAFIRISYAKEFAELFAVFKPISINQQLFRDTLTGLKIASVWLNINFVVVVSIYVFLLSRYFHLYDGSTQFLLLIAVTVTVLLSIRYSLLKMAASLFPFKKEISFYHFNELQINRLTGLLILPFVTFMAFSPMPLSTYAFYLSILLAAAMLLFRYLRGFVIGSEYFARYKFHFLIYICTLEIAPIVILVKLLKEWVSNL